MVPSITGIGGNRHLSSCSASDLALQTTEEQLTGGTRTLLSATAVPDLSTMTTRTYYSEGRSAAPSLKNSLLLPAYLAQPLRAVYDKYSTEGETTMLCTEAYTLIAQHNFKGVSQEDVLTWLRQGFCHSVSRDEGCRVKIDLLFSLLSFISDV